MKQAITIRIEEELLKEVKKRGYVISTVCESMMRDLVNGPGPGSNNTTHTHVPATFPQETAPPLDFQSPTARNAQKIINHLVSSGMLRTDTITIITLQKVIRTIIGGDQRTLRRYTRFLIEEKYLTPAGTNLLKFGDRGNQVPDY